MFKNIIISIILFSSTAVQAYTFKIRAREHVESNTISYSGGETTYKGLTNTINLWWEKPYDISMGFSVSPIIAGIRADDYTKPFGDEVTIVNYGFELKYFGLKKLLPQVYVRPGLTYSELTPDNGVTSSGHAVYLGIGYEYPFEKFGLALEYAHRHSILSDGITINASTPSIGFHFYGYL